MSEKVHYFIEGVGYELEAPIPHKNAVELLMEMFPDVRIIPVDEQLKNEAVRRPPLD